MKKACFAMLLFLAFAFKGYGQYVPLLNDSAVWRQGIRSCTDGGWPVVWGNWNYSDFRFSGDTLINSKVYSKVYLPNNDWWPYAYLREDSGKVYLKYEYESEFPYYSGSKWGPEYFIDTTEFVLYDFSLQVGDTFATRIHQCDDYLNPPIEPIQQSFNFILTQIDTVLLNNGTSRKRFHLENTEEPWVYNYAQTFYSIDWIEGIGSTITFFYNEYNAYMTCGVFDSGYGQYKIACYTLNDTILYGYNNCQIPTDISENENHKISIYPNPVADLLTVKGIANNLSYTIYNIVGSSIKSGIMEGNIVDFSLLTSGMYILQLADKNSGAVHRSRVIKY